MVMEDKAEKGDVRSPTDTMGMVNVDASQTPRDNAPAAGASPASPTPGSQALLPDAVPDGGSAAWLVLLGSFVVMIATWGLVNTFGVYQTYYETDLLHDHSSSAISWIGSLQAAFLMVMGVVSGPLYDRGYVRQLVAAGLFLVVFGMFMTSLCASYWQVVLAQGICVGVGCGLLFLPSTAILSQYFDRHRAVAIGVQSVGSPLAGIVFPIIFSRLQPVVGFAWVTRIIAFILLGMAPVPLLFLRTRVPPAKKRQAFLDVSAFGDVPYLVWGAAGFFAFLGLYVPFFYVQLNAIRYNITSADFSAYLVTLLNAGSVFGRLLPSFLAARLGAMNMLIATTFSASILAFGWLGVDSLAGVVVFALLYGFCNGGVTSLPPSAIVTLTPDMGLLGTRMGMVFMVFGFAVLFGTPVAGAILRDPSDDGAWRGLIAFSASTLCVGGVLFSLAQFLHLKRARRAGVS
ncbi:Uu.00g026350.m01.CDS01 [Anthostomella pinea]|uniref:Uu.00g026350.m01.CDS01 n=1 Tax=Anthostomella pinea TaxID=933095 RepID=A0AAI8V832_9PEZI|nr:Uu.00g026350.m01.CDS01 [Anthostomella pinea]